MSGPMLLLVHALFLLSGAAALAYQITWVRDLTLIFGASYQATSIVLAAFMGGLCLGGFLFGRASERTARPLRTYALIEIGIALYALVLPTLLGWVDAFYVTAALAADGVTPALGVLRIVMASAVLLPPTILMGATLPLLVGGLVRRREDFASRLSWLYGINTLGAVVGATVTGFVLIPALGVWRTQLTAIAVNVAIGLLALAAARRIDPGVSRPAGREPAPSSTPTGAHAELRPADRVAAHLAYRGALVCGMCALALEVMWTRAVSLSVGTTTYSFTVMLTSFLTGIWLGSWLHALLPLRRLSAARQLGFVMLAIGLTSLLASYWIPRLPELVVQLNVALYGVAPRIQNLTTLLAGFVVMLIPCIFMGISFPLTGQARVSLGLPFGRSAGDTIGWNTLGSVAGSLLAGFVLIPTVGLQRGMILAAAVNAVYGCLILGVPLLVAPGRRRWGALGAVGAAIIAALLAPIALPTWDLRNIGAFENNQLAYYVNREGDVHVRGKLDEAVVRYYEEGRASTVSVIDSSGTFRLLVNGKTVAADGLGDIQIQLMLGHGPVLAHPDPKKALVVGLGTGFTLSAVTAHPSLEEVRLVEIEPAVIGAQPQFAASNFDPFSDPRLRVEIQDGRNYLKTTRERFDVITADPIHPWNQGSGYLFTKEYYTTLRDRLAEGGVACQWLPIYGLSTENYKSIIATFVSVFPETTLWQTGIDSMLIGSLTPLELDLDRLAERIAEPTVEEQLRLIGVENVHAFLAELALDAEDVRSYASGAPINTDDNLYLEFASPLSIGTREAPKIRADLNRYRNTSLRESLVLSPEDAAALDLARRAKRATLDAFFARTSLGGTMRSVRAILEWAPGYRPAEILLARVLNEMGQSALRRGRPESAVTLLREAVALAPEHPTTRRLLGAALVASGDPEEAIEQLERSLALRPNRWRSLAELSRAQRAADRKAEAARSLRAAIALNPNDPMLGDELARLEDGEPGQPAG